MNDITIYAQKDFLNSTAPFEEVYKLIDNKFELERALITMAAHAKACGIGNFRKMFKDYCGMIKQNSSPDYTENASNFEGQELELNTGDWQADDFGITKFGNFGEIVACPHPIMPVMRLSNIDTGIERIKIAYKKGKGWRAQIVERNIISSANKIIALSDYGVAVTSENSRDLVNYLHDVENLNYEKIPECNSVGRLGWINGEGFSPYVENLIFDGDLSFKHYFDAVGTKGKENKWMALAKDIRKQGSIPARIMLAASFASVLVEPCSGQTFFCHLWGGTETGKTVGLMLAASVWANPEMGKYIHTFNSTAVAQELSAGFVNSLPLILDELQIVKEKKDFDNMIYQLSEGVGKNRGAKMGGLQKVATWSNCILTTGEQPISNSSSGGGAVNRIIEINCEDTKLFDDPAKVVDIVKANYGFAGKEFVEALSIAENMELARNIQKSIYKGLSTSNDITEKQSLAASLILAADQLINMFIFDDGVELDFKDIVPFLSSKDEVSVNNRAYEWLFGWLAQNMNKFTIIEFSNDIWGTADAEYIYIIGNVFDSACAENGFNPHSFLNWMKRKGYIDSDDKRLKKNKRVGNFSPKCVFLKRPSDFV